MTNNTNSVWAINQNRLLSFSFKLPTKPLINKFNSFCEPIFELQKSNEQIIKRLVKLQKC
ncbi:hypothetical protein B4U78_016585 [Microbacterium esteraromaticum]|nr:hypothetical protein B4U78_016585 [Microbacterium esteraromaticum]